MPNMKYESCYYYAILLLIIIIAIFIGINQDLKYLSQSQMDGTLNE